MDIIISIILGIVQGITEWLPISSTGHLLLVDEFLHMNVSADFMNMFKVVIQLASVIAVIVLYFHKLNPFSPKKIGEAALEYDRALDESGGSLYSICGGTVYR